MTDFVLTPRKRRIVVLLHDGLSYKAIAVKLGISERMVTVHVAEIAAKIDGRGAPRTKVLLHAGALLDQPEQRRVG